MAVWTKSGYCYPSGLQKTLCKWDIYVPLVTKGLQYDNNSIYHILQSEILHSPLQRLYLFRAIVTVNSDVFPSNILWTVFVIWAISGFHHEVAENCTLLGYYAAISCWCFGTIYRSSTQGSRIQKSSTLFPSSNFSHVSVRTLCLAATQVRIPSITKRPSPAALTVTLPSIQILGTTLLADNTLLRHFTVPTLSYINSSLALQAFFWILEP
jgi:hypothetical protein